MSEEAVYADLNKMYEPRDIISLIVDNIRKTRNPLGLSNSSINTWWKNLSIKRDGDAMLFTGLMYQLIPYIEKMTQYLEKYEDSSLKKHMKFVKYVPKFAFRMIFGHPLSEEDKKRFNNILRNIAMLLSKVGIDYYYKPEIDIYSGILLYDLSDINSFCEHAKYVADLLEKNNVKKLITVDPHTTYALKVLYPKYIGTDFEVYTYFEALDKSGNLGSLKKTLDIKVTIHDPCFYGRYLKISEVPRHILRELGVEIVEVSNRKELTICCGGPLESLFPTLSRKLAMKRVDELKKTGLPVVAMCPICHGNLRRVGLETIDLSEVLYQIIF